MPGELRKRCEEPAPTDKDGISLRWEERNDSFTITAECRTDAVKEQVDRILQHSQSSYPNLAYSWEANTDGGCDLRCSVNVSTKAPLNLLQAIISSLKGALILCRRELEERKEHS